MHTQLGTFMWRFVHWKIAYKHSLFVMKSLNFISLCENVFFFFFLRSDGHTCTTTSFYLSYSRFYVHHSIESKHIDRQQGSFARHTIRTYEHNEAVALNVLLKDAGNNVYTCGCCCNGQNKIEIQVK